MEAEGGRRRVLQGGQAGISKIEQARIQGNGQAWL
jgi:hypothetical protein